MSAFDSYPYAVHTKHELELMLAGTKPFAVFTRECIEGFEKSDALSDQDFDTHVSNGTLSEQVRSYQTPMPNGNVITIDRYFYARKGEEWRVEAYCMLLELMNAGIWNWQLEWMEGKLLGYTKEQNLYHMSLRFPDAPVDRLARIDDWPVAK